MKVQISFNGKLFIDRRELYIRTGDTCEATISAETVIECNTLEEATKKTKEFSQEFKEYVKSLREGLDAS